MHRSRVQFGQQRLVDCQPIRFLGIGLWAQAAPIEQSHNPPGDPFGDMMNAPTKYVVSRTLAQPTWRKTEIIRDNVIESVRVLKSQSGGTIMTDGSSQLVHALLEHDLVDGLHLLVYPLTLGSGKRLFPSGAHANFTLRSATPYPTGVVGLDYERQP